MQKRVAVFFGGTSNEHEISVITGMYAVNLLRGAAYDVLPVYLPRTGGMVTGEMRTVREISAPSKHWRPLVFCEGGLGTAKGHKKYPVDVALNCCHGGFGEDGTLSALLKWHRIPSASPDVAMSAVFMDKTLSKAAARGLGIPVLEGEEVREGEEPAMPLPVIVKPARLGSSIGIGVARTREELERALAAAFRLDDTVLSEPYLEGKRDLNCAACRIDGQVVLSPVEEVFSEGDILSFAEKYEERGTHRSAIPASIPPAAAERVQEYTRRLYEGFHGRGVVRADFLLAGEELYFNELNTVPGSLACYLFGDSLTEAKNFLVSLIEAVRPEKEREIVQTGILTGQVFAGKGGKRG